MIIWFLGVIVPGLVYHSLGNQSNMERDLALAEKIRKGDKSSFDDLFRLYYTPLCRFAWYFCRSKEIAEEAVQDMFIHLWTNHNKWFIEISAGAFLYKATRNKVLNLVKSRSVRLKYESDYAQEYAGNGWENDLPADEARIRSMVNQAVEKLPEKCRVVFSLSRNDGLTYDEIAVYLGISAKTVENQMGIAFKKLREELKPKMEKML
jgi:RNA polymerase sigma-70 factor, ECF subfamily